MAENIKIGIDIDDGGKTKNMVKDANELRKAWDGVKESSSRATHGPKTLAAVKAASQPTMEGVEYGQARAAGGTGAAGRDFAKQAQGLGGLVHVYATFAANLFAVSAAFTALRDAADTTNMVKGMDQLGAASGQALGSLAKRLVDVSDGAVSMREAMDATTKGVSSGMTAAQLLQLTEVAKKSSQALGLSMPDALSRLSRATSKLEPELIDELGLYTKLQKSNEDYARSVGKSVTSLSEFEKRQAFLTAVIKEGTDKFAGINIEANSYSKLLASLKNTSQTVLETINTYLGPFIKFMSESPLALGIAVAALAGILIKQAIPAIGHWKEGLKDSATSAASAAAANKEFFDAYKSIARDQAVNKLPDAVRGLGKAAEEGMEKARDAVKNGARLYNKEFNKLLKLDTSQLTADHAKVIEETRTKLQSAASKAVASGDVKKSDAAQARLDTFSTAAPIMLKAIQDQEKYTAALDKSAPRLTVMEALHKKLADSTELTRQKYTILANAADNATFIGPINAFKSLRLSIETMGDSISWAGKKLLLFRGTLTILASSVSFVIGAMGNMLAMIGLVSSALTFLVDWLSINKEKSALFTQSLDTMTEAGTSAYRTLDYLSKLDPLAQLSTASMVAKANALTELVDTSKKAFSDLQNEVASRGTVDTWTNAIWGWIGKDSETKFAKQLATNVSRAINLAGTSIQQTSVKVDLSKALGLDDTSSISQILTALNNAAPAVQAKVLEILDAAGKTSKVGSQAFRSFDDALETTSKAYDEAINTFRNSSPFAKLAEDGIRDIGLLQKALETATPEEGLAKLAKLSDSYTFLKTLPAEAATSILALSGTLKEQAQAVAVNESEIKNYIAAIEDMIAKLDAIKAKGSSNWTYKDRKDMDELKAALPIYENLLNKSKASKSDLLSGFMSATSTFNNAFSAGIKKNIEYLEFGLQQAYAKAGNIIAKSYLALIPDEGVRAKEAEKLNRQAIGLDIQQVKQSMSLIESQRDLRLAVMENTLSNKVDTLSKLETNKNKTPEQIIAGDKGLTKEQETIEAYKKLKGKSLGELGVMAGAKDRGGNSSLTAAENLASNELLPYAQAIAASKEKIIALNAAIKTSNVADTINALADEERRYNKALEDASKALENKKVEFETGKMGMSEEDIRKQETAFATEAARISQSKAVGPAIFGMARADTYKEAKLGGSDDALARAKERLEIDSKSAEQSKINTITLQDQSTVNAKLVKDDERRLAALQQTVALEDAKSNQSLAGVSSAKELLDIQNSLSLLNPQDYADKSKLLAQQQQSIEFSKQKYDLEKRIEAETGTIDAQLKKIGLTAEEKKGYEDKKQSVIDVGAVELSTINSVNDAKEKSIALQYSMSERMKGFSKIVEDSFVGMADAMVEFAKTGKLNFKDLINTMLTDLLRFELRAQMSALYKGFNGLSGIIGSLFSSNTSSGINAPGGSNFGMDLGFPENAKGGVYGIQQYAQGGAFTNSIVNSPTLFRFAKGTGMMGEAGPEAIMPLKRDANGNLGVRTGGGGQTSVVVNNYSNAQATAKETVDSRGNRKIDIVIGEIVAGEIGRPGSAVQQSLGNNFNARPAMARR
jgi:lambda family phage tail tape measure protein